MIVSILTFIKVVVYYLSVYNKDWIQVVEVGVIIEKKMIK